jgi:hypothetical protein
MQRWQYRLFQVFAGAYSVAWFVGVTLITSSGIFWGWKVAVLAPVYLMMPSLDFLRSYDKYLRWHAEVQPKNAKTTRGDASGSRGPDGSDSDQGAAG